MVNGGIFCLVGLQKYYEKCAGICKSDSYPFCFGKSHPKTTREYKKRFHQIHEQKLLIKWSRSVSRTHFYVGESPITVYNVLKFSGFGFGSSLPVSIFFPQIFFQNFSKNIFSMNLTVKIFRIFCNEFDSKKSFKIFWGKVHKTVMFSYSGKH